MAFRNARPTLQSLGSFGSILDRVETCKPSTGMNRLTETTMTWITPQYTDLRFGFEITMYVAAR